MNNFKNVYLIGPMGSGKTTLGRLLAKLLNYTFYDSDTEIEQRTGVSVSWIFELEQESGFRKREEKMIEELTQRQDIVLATGGGCVVTANNLSRLQQTGIVIYLRASVETQLARIIHKKESRPLINCADPAQRLSALLQQRDPLYRSIAEFSYDTEVFDNPPLLAAQIKSDIAAKYKNNRQ